MHSQKNFWAVRAVGSPKWDEHTHAQKLSFIKYRLEEKKKQKNVQPISWKSTNKN